VPLVVYEFEELLSNTRAQLEAMRAKPEPGPAPGVGQGKALDGKIAVEMAADGRLAGLALDPSVLRLDERELAREIMAAVNDAWAKRQGLDESAAAVAALDTEALQRRMTELQDQGLATMRRFTDRMQSILDQAESRVPR
jgi:DNA-binding protein YbaB